jgi:hypothetical protein
MLVPIRCCLLDCLTDVVPRLKAPPFKRERAQDLPPRLDQIQVDGVFGLTDELLARTRERKQQHLRGAMSAQVIDNRIDLFRLCGQPGLDPFQEVDPMGARALGIRLCQRITGRRSEGFKHVPFTPSPVVDRLFRAAGCVVPSAPFSGLGRTTSCPRSLLAASGPVPSRQITIPPLVGPGRACRCAPFYGEV